MSAALLGGTIGDLSRQSSQCKFCGGQIDFTPIEGLTVKLVPTVCDSCHQKHLETARRELTAKYFEDWKRACPPIYHDTDLNHPDMPGAEKQAKVLNWDNSPKGLVIHGVTRRCKSRLAWMLMKRLIGEGLVVVTMTDRQFARQSMAANSGDCDLATWKDSLSVANVLFIDDLGKMVMTERAASDLFDIVDIRGSYKRPIIATTNFVGKDLEARMGSDRGPAIVARLREFCNSVNL